MSEDNNLNEQNGMNTPGEENIPNSLDIKSGKGNNLAGIGCLVIFIVIMTWGIYQGKVQRENALNELTKRNITLTDQAFVDVIKKGDMELFKLMLSAGANVEARGENDSPALLMAADQNKSDMVKALLDRKVKPDARNASGVTPLMAAAEKGNFEIVKMLVEKGADVNAKNNKGETALNLAKVDIIKELLSKKSAPQKSGQPIAQNANIEKLSPQEARRNLEKSGVAYNDNRFVECASKGEFENLQLFVKAGLHPNTKNSDGVNALMAAASAGNIEMVKFLIGKGANVNAADKKGKTVLTYAVKSDIKEILVKAGAK